MEKPVPPRLEDFGLSETEYGKAPKLLRHRFSEKNYSRIGIVAGGAIGLGTLVAFLNKMESALHGWYFGLPIGFVVFLMSAFLSALFFKSLVRALSAAQRFIFGGLSQTARRAFLYGDAMEKFHKDTIKFESQYN